MGGIIMKSVFGYVNGKPVYSRDEYVYACRGFGAIKSDEKLLEFAEKVSGHWYNAGWHRTFTTYYLGDYALDEPKQSLTATEYKRLKELQKAAQAAEQAAYEARCWKHIDTLYFADNSIEEVWEDKDGVRERRMVVAPHGDACY
jgi:hypothetical protein